MEEKGKSFIFGVTKSKEKGEKGELEIGRSSGSI